MIEIDRYANNSNFLTIHPFEKLTFMLISFVISLISNNYIISSFIILVNLFILLVFVKINYKKLFSLLLIPLFFIVTGLLPIIFIFKTVDGSFIYFTKDSIFNGVFIMNRSFACITTFYLFILTSRINEIIYIMKKLRIPSLFQELFFLIYRYIVVLHQIYNDILTSQKIRNGYSTLKRSYHSLSELAKSLFFISFNFSKSSYNALNVRGYNGELAFLPDMYKLSGKNTILLTVYLITLLLLMKMAVL